GPPGASNPRAFAQTARRASERRRRPGVDEVGVRLRKMSRRDERVGLIRALEAARGGTHVIAYLTSTRPNLEAPMAMDAIPLIHRHLEAIGTPKYQTRIDLFIHSNGGDGVVTWRLGTLIREYCAEL